MMPAASFAMATPPDTDPSSAMGSTKAVFVDAKTKAPLAGVTVMVKNLADNSTYKVKTDAHGTVTINNQVNADFEIIVEQPGYKKFEVKSNVNQSSQYFKIAKEETIHPFIRFK